MSLFTICYYFIGSKALCALRRLQFLYKSSNNSCFSSNKSMSKSQFILTF